VLEIIGARYGRTGTLSLKSALERLGFGPCYHAVEFMRHPEHQARWEAAFHGNPEWEQVFAGYRSTVDFPGAAFWRELADAYPQAKVILTVRDPEEWYASMRETFLAAAGPDGQPPIPGASDGTFGGARGWSQMMADLQDEPTAIANFKQHIEGVQSYVPSHRLLVYEVREGWQPLCDFLEVRVPDEPFPRLNDSEAFKELMAQHSPHQSPEPPS
jgi:Sulfotransferase domain